CLLTGRTPIRAGVPGNVGSGIGPRNGMPASEITMAEMLKESGYATALIGKWHLGYTEELQPNGQGFDYAFGHLVGCIDNYSHFYFWNGPNRHDLYRNGEEIFKPGAFFPQLCLDEAAAFIQANADQPFFLYYAMNSPHYPYQGTTAWLQYYNDKNIPYPRNLYNAFVSTTDEYIGKLLKKLEEFGVLENTIIIFQSDHGHSTEERAHFGGGSAGPYRGAKGSLFEGGIRVPAIISWPGHLPQGEVRSQMATAADWLPTIAELCNVPAPRHKIDGTSILPLIKNQNHQDAHEVFHWTFNKQWAIRKGDWKLLYDPQDTSLKRNAPENRADDLYYLVDLSSDIGEQNNLALKYPEIVKEMKDLHFSYLQEVEDSK
ncbi:MAG: sulfatase-like hydrolase/transferase, partial [Saprospiraceae bacterium]|nr:sulfatase-like hydrolase/transferase [Saprospiraceae bacterium]